MRIFNGDSSHTYFDLKKNKVKNEIRNLSAGKLNMSDQQLSEEIYKANKVEKIVIFDDKITSEAKETDINVSQDFSRNILDRSRPFYIKGTQVYFFIPFEGEYELFSVTPSTHTMWYPEVEISHNELILSYLYNTDTENVNTSQKFENDLNIIKSNLSRLNIDIQNYNNELQNIINIETKDRRSRLNKHLKLIESIKYPLKKNQQKEYSAVLPIEAKDISKKLDQIVVEKTTPEYYEISNEIYNEILSSIRSMALVMEKSPNAFKNMDEETLRFQFLIPLNATFKGQVSGETFNFNGKTDILLNYKGKNLFIGECKFWKGKAMVSEVIDQILSYSSWRDTKTAIIFFNRNKNFTSVVNQIKKEVPKHKNYISTINDDRETEFQYFFSHINDEQRKVQIAVMVFNIPILD